MKEVDIITALPEKVVLVRCFDPDIDVALHALKKSMKRVGCKQVREFPLCGGAIDLVEFFGLFERQLQTLLKRGFSGVVFSVHTNCHHVKEHRLLPENSSEHEFLTSILSAGVHRVLEKFPEMVTYSCIINTCEADNGAQSIELFHCSHNHGVTFPFSRKLVLV